MSLITLAKKPKISASLLIFSPIQSSDFQNKSNYELLFLKRKANISFSNVFAFPGGVLEPQDEIFYDSIPNENGHKPSLSAIEEKKYLINRITSLRETFEESGLFFLSAKINPDKSNIYQTIRTLKESNKLTFEKLVENFSLPLMNLFPLIRLITPQSYIKRYDTYFFGIFLNVGEIITLNIGDYLLGGTEDSLFSYKKLQINLEESDTYAWMTPIECYKSYYEGNIDLAPPQVFQICHYVWFTDIKSVEKFYKEVLMGNPTSSNELMRRPQYFPLIDSIKIENHDFLSFLPGDYEYDYKTIAGNEEDEELAKEIIEKNSTINSEKNHFSRYIVCYDDKKRILIKKCWFSDEKPSPLEGLKYLKD